MSCSCYKKRCRGMSCTRLLDFPPHLQTKLGFNNPYTTMLRIYSRITMGQETTLSCSKITSSNYIVNTLIHSPCFLSRVPRTSIANTFTQRQLTTFCTRLIMRWCAASIRPTRQVYYHTSSYLVMCHVHSPRVSPALHIFTPRHLKHIAAINTCTTI